VGKLSKEKRLGYVESQNALSYYQLLAICIRRISMFMIYWSVIEGESKTPHSREFASTEMVEAMKFAEELRTKQRAREAIRFVTLCSENPDAVGDPGVAEPKADYSWKKRRI
jgi:hypothetical protein